MSLTDPDLWPWITACCLSCSLVGFLVAFLARWQVAFHQGMRCPSTDLVPVYPSCPFRSSYRRTLATWHLPPLQYKHRLFEIGGLRGENQGVRPSTAPSSLPRPQLLRPPSRALYSMVRTIGSPTITSYTTGFRCLRRTFLTKSYPTMRNIKPVTLVRLAFELSRIVSTQTVLVVVPFYFTSPRTLSLSFPLAIVR